MGAYLTWTDSTGATQSLFFDLVEAEDWNEDTTITEHPVESGADITDNVRVSLARVTLTVFATNDPIGIEDTNRGAVLTTTPISLDAPGQVKGSSATVAKTWDNKLALRSALTGAGAGLGGLAGGTTGGAIGAVAGAVVGNLLAAPGEQDVPFDPDAGLDPTPGQTVNVQHYALPGDQDFVADTITQLRFLKGDDALGSTPQLLTVVGTKRAADNMVIETLNHQRDNETTGAPIVLGLKQIRLVSTQQVTAPVPTMPRGKTATNKGAQNPTDDANAAKKRSFLKQLLYGTMGGPPATTHLGGS